MLSTDEPECKQKSPATSSVTLRFTLHLVANSLPQGPIKHLIQDSAGLQHLSNMFPAAAVENFYYMYVFSISQKQYFQLPIKPLCSLHATLINLSLRLWHFPRTE